MVEFELSDGNPSGVVQPGGNAAEKLVYAPDLDLSVLN